MRESERPKRPPEPKISFFERSDVEADGIRLAALRKLRISIVERSQQIGLDGNGLQNCLEDWVNEAYIKAQEQFERWDPRQGDSACWVYLKAKDIANRWFQRFYTERRKLGTLVYMGSSLVHDRERAEEDFYSHHDNRALVQELLRDDLSLSDARILKLYHAGVEIEEISDLEGLSKATAQRRLNRAQAKARKARSLRDSKLDLGAQKMTGRPTPRPPTQDKATSTEVQNQKRRLTP